MTRFPLAALPIALALAATPALAQAPAPACVPTTFELVKDSGIGCVTSSSRTAHRHQPATMVFDMCGAGTEVFGPLNVTFRLKGSGSFRTLDGKAA